MEYEKLDQALKTRAEEAINMALDLLSLSLPIMPFILYGQANNKLERFQLDDLEEAIELANEFIDEIEDGTRVAILCYLDMVQLNDGDFKAIIVQVYSTDEDTGYSFAQVYQLIENNIQLSNQKIFLGAIRNVLVF